MRVSNKQGQRWKKEEEKDSNHALPLCLSFQNTHSYGNAKVREKGKREWMPVLCMSNLLIYTKVCHITEKGQQLSHDSKHTKENPMAPYRSVHNTHPIICDQLSNNWTFLSGSHSHLADSLCLPLVTVIASSQFQNFFWGIMIKTS